MLTQPKTPDQNTQALVQAWLANNKVTICPPAIAQGAVVDPYTKAQIAQQRKFFVVV